MTEIATTYDHDEWVQQRLGCVTASRISDVVAKRKDGYPAASRQKYLIELALERVTGHPQDTGYQSEAMLRGIQLEPEALENYTWATEQIVTAGEYVPHPVIARAGATPDGIVVNGNGIYINGIVEVKCPESHTHWATLEGQGIDKKYIDQMQWQMACTQADWCDFVSYDPRFTGNGCLYRERIPRDDMYIAQLEKEVELLLREVHKKEAWYRETFA